MKEGQCDIAVPTQPPPSNRAVGLNWRGIKGPNGLHPVLTCYTASRVRLQTRQARALLARFGRKADRRRNEGIFAIFENLETWLMVEQHALSGPGPVNHREVEA